MQAAPRVRLTDPSEDRFPLRSAIAAFVGCALLGVVGARLWLAPRFAPTHRAPAGAPAAHAPTPEADAPAAMTAEPVAPESAQKRGAPDAGPAAPVAPAPDVQPPSTPEPNATAPAPPAPVRARTFEQGQVAYLRCDGAEQPDARFPCPRDRAFEDAVWAVLHTLPECPTDGIGTGRGEVRLSWAGRDPTEVLVKVEGSENLRPEAVSKCAGDRLSALRSSLPTTRAIAAFRFELR